MDEEKNGVIVVMTVTDEVSRDVGFHRMFLKCHWRYPKEEHYKSTFS